MVALADGHFLLADGIALAEQSIQEWLDNQSGTADVYAQQRKLRKDGKSGRRDDGQSTAFLNIKRCRWRGNKASSHPSF